MKNFISFFTPKILKGLAIGLGSLLVVWLLWEGVKSTIIDPAVKKAVAPYRESLLTSRDSTSMYIKELNTAMKLADALDLKVDTLESELGEAKYMHEQKVQQLQSTVARVIAREKNLQKLNKQLSTGIQVDLMKLIYKKPLLKKELELIDSTYQEAYRYGTID